LLLKQTDNGHKIPTTFFFRLVAISISNNLWYTKKH